MFQHEFPLKEEEIKHFYVDQTSEFSTYLYVPTFVLNHLTGGK